MAFTPNIRHGQVISVRHDGGGVFDGMEIEGDMEGEVEVVVYNSLTLDESCEKSLLPSLPKGSVNPIVLPLIEFTP